MSRWFYVLMAASALLAQTAGQTAVTIEGKTMSLKYAAAKAPGPATFHTDADLVFKGFTVPRGDYSVTVAPAASGWQLLVTKPGGAKVGSVAMTVSKAAAPAPAYKMGLTKTAALAAKIEAIWENNVASTSFYLDRAAEHSEW